MVDHATEIDLGGVNTSHAQVVDLVGSDHVVLVVGPSTDDLARALLARGCDVSRVELDDEPFAADAELRMFDAIVLDDVLGNLVDPVGALRGAATHLAPGGRLVISVANVTHGANRLALLQGRWELSTEGLLDQTHLRAFSGAGLQELAHHAGLVIDDLRGTVADPLSVESGVDAARLPAPVVEWVREQQDALIHRYVLSARPGIAGEDPLHAVVTPAVGPQDVRLRDVHTLAAVKDQDERRRVLTVRDHILGLEATAASAEARASRVQSRAKRLRQRVDSLEKQNQRLQDRVAGLEQEVAELRGKGARTHVADAVSRRLHRG